MQGMIRGDCRYDLATLTSNTPPTIPSLAQNHSKDFWK